MKKLITALVIAALLLTLAPATVVYAAPGDVTGSAKGGNTAPTVVALTIVQTGSDTQETAMVPLTEYRVKATLGDINTIDDIVDIEFHVYNTSDGAQSASSKWNAGECAIFKWNKGTGLWTMENDGATTTWGIVTGNCIVPSVFTDPTGVWYLAFRPGELAQADASQNWHAWVRVDDENKNGTGSTETLSSGATMGVYSEISLDAATIVFGDAGTGIEPGQTGYITDPVTLYLTAQVGTNATYALGVKSDATWADGGATISLSGTTVTPPAGVGEFTLLIDDETSGGGVPKFTTQGVTTSNTTITGHGLDGPTPTDDDASEGTLDTVLYMALALSLEGVDEVTYTGTITFTATN